MRFFTQKLQSTGGVQLWTFRVGAKMALAACISIIGLRPRFPGARKVPHFFDIRAIVEGHAVPVVSVWVYGADLRRRVDYEAPCKRG